MIEPYYQDSACTIYHGDCRDILINMDGNSIDSIVADPPYGLSFMGKQWDYDVPSVDIWRECLRVLKPGGHLLSFAGTRTHHRMVVNIEDAGFEIRDMIAWIYGSGFPKSLDVSKAIDKASGAEREVIGEYKRPDNTIRNYKNWSGKQSNDIFDTSSKIVTKPATPEAKQWNGFGTALKPALEPITVARKPLSEKTVAANVLKWGTGAINIDGCRVEGQKRSPEFKNPKSKCIWKNADHQVNWDNSQGRWPANLIHDGSQMVLDLFPETEKGSFPKNQNTKSWKMSSQGKNLSPHRITDKGSAARFFYCAKASKKERGTENNHPTVKPIKLMQYLCRLATPPGGVILDPFMGSGTSGIAACNENFQFIGIEIEEKYCEIAAKRLAQEVLPL